MISFTYWNLFGFAYSSSAARPIIRLVNSFREHRAGQKPAVVISRHAIAFLAL